MRQNIHLISNSSSISPMDTWKLSGEQIKPTTGWQAAAGVYWTELNTGIDFYRRGLLEADLPAWITSRAPTGP